VHNGAACHQQSMQSTNTSLFSGVYCMNCAPPVRLLHHLRRSTVYRLMARARAQ